MAHAGKNKQSLRVETALPEKTTCAHEEASSQDGLSAAAVVVRSVGVRARQVFSFPLERVGWSDQSIQGENYSFV